MADDRKARLDALIKRRDVLREAVQRAKGRKDAALKELATVEEECRARGIEPDQLSSVRAKLTEKYDEAEQTFNAGVCKGEVDVKPYLEETIL